MDHHPTRSAEIRELRQRVADGSRDIERVYLPLAQLLAEAGERDEAIAVCRGAIQRGLEAGFFLKAVSCLRFAQALAPNDPTLAADESRLRAAMDPSLWAHATRQSERRTAMPRVDALNGHFLTAFERCTITTRLARNGTVDVTIDHPNEAVPTDWITLVRYALVVDGCTDPIPCTARVTDATRTHHRLTLKPASPAAEAALRWNVRTHPGTGQSNIAALLLDIGAGEPFRLRNVYHDASIAAPN